MRSSFPFYRGETEARKGGVPGQGCTGSNRNKLILFSGLWSGLIQSNLHIHEEYITALGSRCPSHWLFMDEEVGFEVQSFATFFEHLLCMRRVPESGAPTSGVRPVTRHTSCISQLNATLTPGDGLSTISQWSLSCSGPRCCPEPDI